MRFALVGTLTMTLAATAHADAIPMSEKPDHVTEAIVTVDAPPDEVYRAVTDYAQWPTLLSDVMSARVESGGREDARVKFRSRVLGHEFTIAFANIPDRQISFQGVEGPPGGRAKGTYTLTPVDGGKRTRVVADLYLDVVGPAGWVVRSSKTRDMRQAKLQRDLADVEARFAQHGG
jgi:uncharacterized protein YndB with AHSA1/START domain